MKIEMVIILIILACTGSAFGQVVVIANKSVPVDRLEKSDLLDFYTGDIRKWSDKQPVVVLDLKPQSETKKIFYHFLGKRSSRMKSIWLKKMLSGEGDPPVSMKSEEDLLKKVASTPGAIGYVHQAKVSAEVKILVAINGVKEDE